MVLLRSLGGVPQASAAFFIYYLRAKSHSWEASPLAKRICLQLEGCCVIWQNARAACYKAKKRGRSWPERGEKLRLEKNHCCLLLFQDRHSADGMRQILFLLLFVALSCAAKPKRQQTMSEWDYRSEAEKVNMKGCANLTVVLDNWKFAIMTQFKNLLLYDHQTVLPDYGRIKSLSDALDDLYKEFNALKERLGELTTRFEGVESFVDEMNKGHSQPSAKTPMRVTQPEVEKAAAPVLARRRRIRILNGRKPTEPLTDGTQ